MIVSSINKSSSSTSPLVESNSSGIVALQRQRANLQRQIQAVQASNAEQAVKDQQIAKLKTQLQLVEAQIQMRQTQATTQSQTANSSNAIQAMQTQKASQMQSNAKAANANETVETGNKAQSDVENATDIERTKMLYKRNGIQTEATSIYGGLDVFA